MSTANIFPFLEALTANNSKEWMDTNRKWYHQAKDEVIDLFEPILASLKEIDPRIVQPNARRCINRINNNLMFHPDRPTYKDHFGVGFGYGKGLADFYIHLGVDETLIAGGLWHPNSDKLRKVRTEIDYEGDRLNGILQSSPFKDWFEIYQDDKLKSAPKGFSKDHEHIELLKLKSIAAMRMITREDILSDRFHDMVVESYKTIVPLLDFVNVPIQED